MTGAHTGGQRMAEAEFLQVLTTTASQEDAEAIAAALLQARLAACVQVVGPVESRFWWEGRVEQATEWLCLAKTTASRYEGVESLIRERHSYDEPEILAVPVARGSESYLRWVAGAVRPTP